jgi:hypothetical protein
VKLDNCKLTLLRVKGVRGQRKEIVDEKRLKKESDFITSSIESFSSERA